MPFKAFFFMMNIIYSKPHNKLLHERVNKLKFISINTRTRVKENIKVGAEITKKKKLNKRINYY